MVNAAVFPPALPLGRAPWAVRRRTCPPDLPDFLPVKAGGAGPVLLFWEMPLLGAAAMSSLGIVWSRIATKLYLALGTAVFLTLLSAGVGVFYLERSGDLNHRVESEGFPAYRDVWAVSRAAVELGLLGEVLLAQARAGQAVSENSESVDGLLSSLESSLSRPAGLPGLAGEARAVHDAAFSLAGVADGLLADRGVSVSLALRADSLGGSLDGLPRVGPGSGLLPALPAVFPGQAGSQLGVCPWDCAHASCAASGVPGRARRLFVRLFTRRRPSFPQIQCGARPVRIFRNCRHDPLPGRRLPGAPFGRIARV